MKLTVMVPTYRRCADLQRCLEALKQQTRPADEVLVIVRDTDDETWAFLASYAAAPLPLQPLVVKASGVVAAMNVGLTAARGDIIASTDDDAAPRLDWLQQIEAYFLADATLGGVGGRDWQYIGQDLKETGACAVVGKLQWFGRVIGNHHLGVGGPRAVDVLKGVNMAYRRMAIEHLRFDDRMWGSGAQVHFELAFTLAVRRAGWKLIYDPAVAVNHYPAQRFDEDQRDQFNPLALVNAVHNETLALLSHLPPIQRLVFLLWSVLVGHREARGLVQLLRFWPQEGMASCRKWRAAMWGRWQGWQTWRNSQWSAAPTTQPTGQLGGMP
jgi:cellulose synthase/poly-beta-1,6-N-acetylglucosamine synthase-like glycosyltransferase